jgi:hypothetical protein
MKSIKFADTVFPCVIVFSLIGLIFFQPTNVYNLEANDNQTADLKISNDSVKFTKSNIENELANKLPPTNEIKVSAGQDMVVLEGDVVTLNGSIANSMPIAEQSLHYLWKQYEGPKIDLLQNADGNKSVNFIAPNRPNDTRYVFELNVIETVSNEDAVKNVTLGKDSVNILVTDVNKIAKGLSSEPVTDAGVSETNFSSADEPANFEDTKDGNGEDTKDGNGEDTKDGNGEDTKDGNGED